MLKRTSRNIPLFFYVGIMRLPTARKQLPDASVDDAFSIMSLITSRIRLPPNKLFINFRLLLSFELSNSQCVPKNGSGWGSNYDWDLIDVSDSLPGLPT